MHVIEFSKFKYDSYQQEDGCLNACVLLYGWLDLQNLRYQHDAHRPENDMNG